MAEMPGRMPRLILTPGEPAGIGPDLAVSLAARPPAAELVVVADPELLRERARRLDLALRIAEFHDTDPPSPARPGVLKVWPLPLAAAVRCGRPDPANARSLLQALERACRACLAGRFTALVTGPLHKSAIRAAGFPFTGHTEYLADLCQVPQPVMLLAGGGLRVALATTHLPLADVPAAITPRRLRAVLVVLCRDLGRYYGLAAPRIRVCGLNPHAGEDGSLGDAERRVIAPVLDELRAGGMRLEGPLAADTAFVPAGSGEAGPAGAGGADAVLAMYHDQGLPAVKALGFGETVNITLGLPFPRCSVDHGTALALAGTGRARAHSLRAALRLAMELSAGCGHGQEAAPAGAAAGVAPRLRQGEAR
ncbi:MAG: 4-hydroxythreonine-4-phosphate dehydrogenase PdxA [Gammaproteobacteria bacterium]|nr:4-hydroxythreonine-4-phosphate dehydrogenase PdxA [Gammaproteobacteria bacterium]